MFTRFTCSSRIMKMQGWGVFLVALHGMCACEVNAIKMSEASCTQNQRQKATSPTCTGVDASSCGKTYTVAYDQGYLCDMVDGNCLSSQLCTAAAMPISGFYMTGQEGGVLWYDNFDVDSAPVQIHSKDDVPYGWGAVDIGDSFLVSTRDKGILKCGWLRDSKCETWQNANFVENKKPSKWITKNPVSGGIVYNAHDDSGRGGIVVECAIDATGCAKVAGLSTYGSYLLDAVVVTSAGEYVMLDFATWDAYKCPAGTRGGTAPGTCPGFIVGKQFKHPRGMAVDAGGNFIVSDTYNHCIKRCPPTGANNYKPCPAIVGTCGTIQESSGQSYSYPMGVSVAPDGDIVSCYGHNSKGCFKCTPNEVSPTAWTSCKALKDSSTSKPLFALPKD